MHDCVMYGSKYINETEEEETFPYGIGDSTVMITVTVPVMRCHSCGFSYTDYRAEEIRDNAILPYRQSHPS